MTKDKRAMGSMNTFFDLNIGQRFHFQRKCALRNKRLVLVNIWVNWVL